MFEQQAQYIEERLANLWDDRTQIIFDATRETPTRGEPFVRIQVQQTDSVLVSGTWDNGIYLDHGLATIEVYTIKNQGASANYVLCDLIQQIYHNWQRDRLKCLASYVVRIGQEKEFYHNNVYVPFFFNWNFKAP